MIQPVKGESILSNLEAWTEQGQKKLLPAGQDQKYSLFKNTREQAVITFQLGFARRLAIFSHFIGRLTLIIPIVSDIGLEGLRRSLVSPLKTSVMSRFTHRRTRRAHTYHTTQNLRSHDCWLPLLSRNTLEIINQDSPNLT